MGAAIEMKFACEWLLLYKTFGMMNRLLTAVGSVALLLPSAASSRPATRPNIIFILTDQQTSRAMSCADNPFVGTPAMDALAADGVRLTRAYCPFPLSGPCRASLMTGRTAWQVGVTDNEQQPSPEAMAASIGLKMRSAGYEPLYAGKWHIPQIEVPEGMGFTKICGMDDRTLVDNCAPYLSRKYDKPLFLVASFLDPHEICEYARCETLPYGPLADYRTEECPNLPPNFMPSTYEAEALRLHHAMTPRIHDTYAYTQDDWRRYLYAYYRLVERVDLQVGRLVDLLKRNGLYDNSLIIFASDHGDGVAAHQWNQKWALFEEVVGVPLIVKAPKGGLRGAVNDTALSNIGLDIFATICDYAGVAPGEGYRGRSYRPLVEGGAKELQPEVFIETTLSGIDMRAWSIVEGRYKYVLYNYYRNREQLYDLLSDPGEMVNLAVDRAYAPELQRLRAKLLDWAQYTGEPRLLRNIKPLVK